jgi:hypothetical protein
MSVLITVKVPGNTEQFRTALAERGEEFVSVVERAQSMGAVHHRFGIGDGFVLAVDEWDSPASFEKFFADPDMQVFIGSIGGDTSAAPDITIAEAVSTPDQF